MDYFTLFNLPKKFKINQKLLSKNFYILQSKCHPDLFINNTNLKQKKIMLKKSVQINQGYKTLKHFLSRAIYLLFLNGIKIKTETVLLDQNRFLMEYFSLYEQIDDLKKHRFNQENWNNALEKLEKKIISCEKNIELDFEKNNYKNIILTIEKLLFLKKIKSNLKKEQNLFLRQEN